MTVPPAWQSLHVFIHDFARLDHFLQHCLAAMPPAFGEASFFIRYWHGGPHVRVRFRDAGNGWRALFEQRVAAYMGEHGFASTLEPERYYQAYATHWDSEGPRGWHANGTVHAIAYQPELARYGGAAGLALCEDYFVADSRATLHLLAGGNASRTDQVLLGYCLAQAQVLAEAGLYDAWLETTTGAAAGTAVGTWCNARAGTTLARLHPQLVAVRAAIARGDHLAAWLAPFSARVHTLLTALQAAHVAAPIPILHALLHMSFNRAGIAPAREDTIRLFATYACNQEA